jgi:hypothetical protein
MRSEAQKEARRRYDASEKGKAAKKRHDAAYAASGKRKLVESRRSQKPVSEARKATRKEWAARNKEYFAKDAAYRRALLAGLPLFDLFVFEEALALARMRTKMLGVAWEIDHVIPVSKGGTSEAHNLQVVPAIWNKRKANLHAERFFSSTPRGITHA